jgi:hypothetical protein
VTTRWGVVRWDADEPEGTRVFIELRSGNTKEPDESWSDWVAYGDPSGSKVQNPPGRFIQYRANFHSTPGGPTPTLSRFELIFRPQNQPPTVKFDSFRTEQWRGKKLVQWQGSDPDNDKITYLLTAQGAAGATELAKDIFERSHDFDTAKLRDGIYRLRVTISDGLSNPENPLSAQDESVPVTIDNTPPTVQIEGKTEEKESLVVALRVTASDNLTLITSAEFRVDTDEWKALPTVDGIFDSTNESMMFTIRFRDLKDHAIEVQVRDAAGNIGKATYNFRSPNSTSESKGAEEKKGQ